MLTTGLLKLFGPLFLVLPGLIAWVMFPELGAAHADQAYGQLVNAVLPVGLVGFFAAAMLGAILSSYNSALNSTCTLFSLGLYQGMLVPQVSEREAVVAGKLFGWAIAAFFHGYCAPVNGAGKYFWLPSADERHLLRADTRRGAVRNAFTADAVACRKDRVDCRPLLVASGYFIDPVRALLGGVHEYHFLGLVFLTLIAVMLVIQGSRRASSPGSVLSLLLWT